MYTLDTVFEVLMRKKSKNFTKIVAWVATIIILALSMLSMSACIKRDDILGSFYGQGMGANGIYGEVVLQFKENDTVNIVTEPVGDIATVGTGTYRIFGKEVIIDIGDEGSVVYKYDKKTNSLSSESNGVVLYKMNEAEESAFNELLNDLLKSSSDNNDNIQPSNLSKKEQIKIIEEALLDGTVVATGERSVLVKVPLSPELISISKLPPNGSNISESTDMLSHLEDLETGFTLIEVTASDYRLLAYDISKNFKRMESKNGMMITYWYTVCINRWYN